MALRQARRQSSPERRAWDASVAGGCRQHAPPGASTVTAGPSEPARSGRMCPAGLEDVVSRVMPAVVRVEDLGRNRQRLLRPTGHGADQRARRERRHLRHAAPVGRVERPGPRRLAIAGVRHRRAQGDDAIGQPGRDSAWFGQDAAPRPGSDGDRLGAGHAAKQRDARHRQRRARKPRRHAGANRHRGQPGQQRRSADGSNRNGDRHHHPWHHRPPGLELRRRDRPRARHSRRPPGDAAGRGADAGRHRHCLRAGGGPNRNASRTTARASFLHAIEALSRGAADALDVEWQRFRHVVLHRSRSTDRSTANGSRCCRRAAMPAPVPAGQCSSYFSNFKTEAERFSAR